LKSSLFDEIAQIHDVDQATTYLFDHLNDRSNHTLIKEAIAFSTQAHEGQFRKSGEAYIVHPILVATIVASIGGDDDMVIASLLHDVVEDTHFSLEEIERKYGGSIAHLVDGLTKITEIKEEYKVTANKGDEKLIASALSFRKMLLASIEDIRILVIKLCDRVHNMLTLDALPPAKQKKIAEETIVVFAPIAHRLGIARLKNILEDKSFYYILPDNYQQIDSYIKKNQDSLTLKLNSFITRLKNHLINNGIEEGSFEIKSRVKHYYSIYLKTQRKGVGIDEVLDLLAIRLILKSPNQCYQALGVIHQNFRPIMARFKDYIAIPKENGYQTLHTTIFDDTDIFEIQIRTAQMDENAEFGMAAHYRYKGGDESHSAKWLKSLEYNSKDITEFYELVKNDLYSDDIIVISPKGDNFTLPRSAIALDFAFAIHSDVGKRAVDAYINGEKKSLLTILKNGDNVRIETAPEEILRCSWIDSVKTSRAKESIKQCCKAKIKEINLRTNINILSHLFKDDYQRVKELLENDQTIQTQLSNDINSFESFKELKGKIRQHLIDHSGFLGRLKLQMTSLKKRELDNFNIYSNSTVSSVSFDYCCHPKFGDEIVSFRDGKKAVIHHKLCHVVAQHIEDDEVQMNFIEWKKKERDSYSMIVSLESKKGALAEYLQYLSKYDVNVLSLQLGHKGDEFISYCHLTIETDTTDLNKIKSIVSRKAKLIEIYQTKDAYKES
jgi:GTP pyrophosphokinase/guanosine-3',5'-bis(diphosphate) 3'-pyrophosphohydrolase